MTITYRDIGQVTLEQLQSLVRDAVPESQVLDYKRQAIQPRELCQLLSAFANTKGGCVIFGMDEGEHGVARELLGVIDDADELTRSIEQSAANTIRPRVALRSQTVPVNETSNAVIIGVSKSLQGPHMWVSGDSRRILTRLDRSNTAMDIDEIRRNVLYSQSGEEVASKLHQDMLSQTQCLRFEQNMHIYLTLSAHLPPNYGEIFSPTDTSLLSQLGSHFSHLHLSSSLRPTFSGASSGSLVNRGALSVGRNGSIFLLCLEDTKGCHLANNDVIRQVLPADVRNIYRCWLAEMRSAFQLLGYSGVVYICASMMCMKEKYLEVNQRRTGGNYDFKFVDKHLHMPSFAVDTNIEDWQTVSDDWMVRMWNAAGIAVPHDIE